VFDLLDASDLRFGRWVRQAPYRPQCGVVSEVPHGRQIAALPPAEQFAAMELFRGTMVRHSLIAYRADDPQMELSFGSAHLHDFVPHRVATAVIIEPGAHVSRPRDVCDARGASDVRGDRRAPHPP
jgi:hypothetical protein